MSDADRQRWEARYTAGHRCATDPPSEFLAAHADLMRGRVLDIAAGRGRNALFLARRGCVVDAVDISFAGLHIADAAARAEHLDVRVIQADLEAFPLPASRYDAIINIRYLQRSLFLPMQRAVRPGGIILFETFLAGQETIGHIRNPHFLLQPGELRAAFSRCEILVYEEGLLPARPEPAYLARAIVRRPVGHQD